MTDQTRVTDDYLWERLGEVSEYEKFDVLGELAQRAMDRGASDRALTFLLQMEAEARDLGDDSMVANALHSRGVLAFNSGNYTDAATCYRESADLYAQAERRAHAARSRFHEADAYRHVGDVDAWLRTAEQAWVQADQSCQPALAGDACLLLAMAHDESGDAQAVLNACLAGRERLQRAGHAHKVAAVDDLAIDAHLRLGQLEEAGELAAQRLQVALAMNTGVPESRARLGWIQQYRGHHRKALKAAKRARAEFAAVDDPAGVAGCLWLRAQALSGLGDYAKAIPVFEQAQALLMAAGEPVDALRCQAGHAEALYRAGDYPAAIRWNRRLIDECTGIPGMRNDARCAAVRLVDALFARGRYDEIAEQGDELMRLWPEGTTGADPQYRTFLARWAYGLFRCGRGGHASAMAAHVLKHAEGADEDVACCLEVRARDRVVTDRSAALPDLAGAVAGYLAHGDVDRARELAEYMNDSTTCDEVTESSAA